MAKIILDIDGVIADFTSKVIDIFNKRENSSLKLTDFNNCNFYAAFSKKDADHIIKIFNEPGFFSTLELLPEAKNTVNELIKEGHTIEICTSPPHNINSIAIVEKLEWIYHNFPHLALNTTVTYNKFNVRGNIIVDDTPKNIILWCNEHPEGIGYLISQPWNETFDSFPHNAVRGNFVDLPKFLENYFDENQKKFLMNKSDLETLKKKSKQ